MKNTDKFVALIMIGGQSKRIGGGIKSFIEFNNKYLFDRIFERIKPQVNQVLVNCNIPDKRLIKYNLKILKDIKTGYLGPLAGIHSALNWVNKYQQKTKWIITIPGDTPFIPENLVTRIKAKISKNTKIILAQSNNKTHPAIGAWHASLLDSLDEQLDRGVRKILSWAELHTIEYVNYSFDEYDPFFNINHKEDIDKAKKIEINFINK